MASSFFNIGSIVGGVTLGWLFDPTFGQKALFGLALGTLVGGALQLGVQLPSLRKVGFRFRPDFQWRDEGVKTILRMMGPAIIAASSVQVNVMVNTWFASWLESGSVYGLNIAFRLMQLPLGIFGVAIGTVTLPLLSRIAATENRGDFGAVLGRGLRLGFLLTVPATLGLLLLARPIISLLYEHGKFDAEATNIAAMALQGYAIGLCAYSALKILTPAFYAIDRRRTPMMVSFLSIGLNIGVNWLFAFHLKWGVFGLALGTGSVAVANFLILYFLMRRETTALGTRDLAITFLKLIIPSALLAAVCWGSRQWLLADWAGMPLWMQIGLLFGTIGVAGGVFFLAALPMRIEELEDLKALVRRKLRRRAA
jgi:putative peptidoglycan lipid II flippase